MRLNHTRRTNIFFGNCAAQMALVSEASWWACREFWESRKWGCHQNHTFASLPNSGCWLKSTRQTNKRPECLSWQPPAKGACLPWAAGSATLPQIRSRVKAEGQSFSNATMRASCFICLTSDRLLFFTVWMLGMKCGSSGGAVGFYLPSHFSRLMSF